MSEEARFDLARKLTLVDAQQRYSFLEATVSAMDAHMRYYQRSAEVRAYPHVTTPTPCQQAESWQPVGISALLERLRQRLRHAPSPV